MSIRLAFRLAGIGLLVVLFVTTQNALAQTSFGVIVGTVSDPSQAAVPDVSLTVTNTQTGIARQVKSDQFGNYRVESLLPGVYSIRAEHSGFRVTEVTGVELPVARTVTVNITMQLGAVAERVEVTAAAPLLDTATATVGTVVDNQNVVLLPLNGRAFTDLLLLIPGSVPGNPLFAISGGHVYSVSGNPSDQNNYTLDGLSDNEPFFKQFAIQPSIDAIQEFKVQTNITSAEYGSAAGANVNVALKSGTNQLHGAAFEFLRNDKLDAVDWFRNYNSTAENPATRPAYKRNNYGGVIGGPLYIPHLYDGRDKAFWMFNYEGTKIRRASTAIATIPTSAQLAGDLRDQPPIYDPFTTRQIGTDSSGNPIYARDRLSCNGVLNVICPDRIDPYVAAWSPIAYPATNVTGPGNIVNTNNYVFNSYQINTRADYKIKDNLTFFARYSQSSAGEEAPQGIPPFSTNTNEWYKNAVASWTWVATPTSVMDLKFGFNRTNLLQFTPVPPPGAAALLAEHPLQGTIVKDPKYPVYPTLYIQNYSNPFQQGVPLPTTDVQGVFNVSLIRGRHTIKTGTTIDNFRGSQDNFYNNSFSFTNIPTSDPQDPSGTGSGLASYLLGIPVGGNRNVGDTKVWMQWSQFGFYVQDDIKMTKRLTLNVGLRWEFDQSPRDKFDRLGMFDRTANQFVWASKNPVTGAGPNVRPGIRDPDWHDFAPRVGMAYQVGSKTTVRSGYGIFYAPNTLWETQGIRGQWPYAVSENLTGLNTIFPTTPMEIMFPAYTTPTPQSLPAGSFAVGRTDKVGYSQQWNLGVQRELAKDLLLEIDYIGSKGTKLSTFVSQNAPRPGPGVIGSPEHPRPYPQVFGTFNEGDRASSSIYHSLQVKAEKRFSNGLQFLATYAWGHEIDTAGTGTNNGPQIQDPYNIRASRGNGSFDFRHIFTASYNYELPFGRGKRFVSGANSVLNQFVGGWQLTGITRFTSGGPVNVGLTFDNTNTGYGGDRPNGVPGQPLTAPASGDKTQGLLNPAAYSIPPQYAFGTLGRNTARAPGFQNWDFGIYKNFPLPGEKKTLQFRTEFFNGFNNVNLGGPNAGFCQPLPACNPSFGRTFSTVNTQREIQLALKFLF
ncbi:MAG TPA: TonB-dependent receptor [Terriglobia bacterium]|nr:TonB-dependent receptor [Terriglobia bacterium]